MVKCLRSLALLILLGGKGAAGISLERTLNIEVVLLLFFLLVVGVATGGVVAEPYPASSRSLSGLSYAILARLGAVTRADRRARVLLGPEAY